jgi:hypothetical protein
MASERNVIASKPIVLSKQDFAQIEVPDLSDEVRKIIIDSKVKSLQAFVSRSNPSTLRDNIYKYWGISADE